MEQDKEKLGKSHKQWEVCLKGQKYRPNHMAKNFKFMVRTAKTEDLWVILFILNLPLFGLNLGNNPI